METKLQECNLREKRVCLKVLVLNSIHLPSYLNGHKLLDQILPCWSSQVPPQYIRERIDAHQSIYHPLTLHRCKILKVWTIICESIILFIAYKSIEIGYHIKFSYLYLIRILIILPYLASFSPNRYSQGSSPTSPCTRRLRPRTTWQWKRTRRPCRRRRGRPLSWRTTWWWRPIWQFHQASVGNSKKGERERYIYIYVYIYIFTYIYIYIIIYNMIISYYY